jgi:branched-chain amino acid transport system permease protein
MYWQRVLCISAIYALLAIGFDFLANFVGLVSLGGALFVGVGGYIFGLSNSHGLSPLLAMPVATVAGAAICTLVLLPTLPLRGVYFAIVSFVYPLMVTRLIVATGVAGGTEGISGLDMSPNIWVSQYVVLGFVLICLFVFRRIVNQDVGLVFRGLKDNDQAIRASGIDVTYYRAMAVFLAALLGCFAGAFLSYLYGWVGTSLFAIDFSVFPVAATVVGGPGTLAGPVLGALILVPISEALRAFGTLRIVFYSIVIILFIVFWREGLLNYLRRRYEQFNRWVKV